MKRSGCREGGERLVKRGRRVKKGVIIRGKVGRRMKMGRRVIIREEVGWRSTC